MELFLELLNGAIFGIAEWSYFWNCGMELFLELLNGAIFGIAEWSYFWNC